MYLLVKNTRYIQNNTASCAGEMFCLIFVPFYSLYWWYTRGETFKHRFDEQNYSSTVNGIVYLVLAILGWSIVSMAILQSDFNSLNFETLPKYRNAKEELITLKQQRQKELTIGFCLMPLGIAITGLCVALNSPFGIFGVFIAFPGIALIMRGFMHIKYRVLNEKDSQR